MSVARVPRQIQSIDRAAAILRLLSGRAPRLGVVQLSEELGLAKGTVHGLLKTLQQHALVERDRESVKYQLGAAVVPLGLRYRSEAPCAGRR